VNTFLKTMSSGFPLQIQNTTIREQTIGIFLQEFPLSILLVDLLAVQKQATNGF
jgi:hypothetical protein